MQADPRYTQIAILLCLVSLGTTAFQINIAFTQLFLSTITALLSQYGFSVAYKKSFDWRSPLITGLSLSILLRMNDPYWACVAAFIAIASKFLFRVQQRHIVNPANFAIVVLLLCGGDIWVSPSQWGSTWVLGLLLIVLGISVLAQTRQWDIAFEFLLFYAVLLVLRASYLGDDYSIPLHQLQSGALLIFAFFMLSDPKTIPNYALGRVAFAALVAVVAFYLQFDWYIREAIFYALFASSIVYCVVTQVLVAYKRV